MQPVQIPSSGARMNGVLYLAKGKGPHPTVLFLHGFPGTEKNTDLAHVVRRAGFNTLVFHYRGAWGSEGVYSYSHVLEDVAAALQWLRQPAVADSYRVNPRRLILVGHSLGGFAALYGAAADSGVRAVAALAPGDWGRRGERLKDPEGFAASVRRLDPQLGPLRGTSGKTLAQDVVDHATEWHLERYAHVLAGKRVLLVAATRDVIVPLGEVYEPLGVALRREGAQHLTAETLDADHAFSNSRVRLARLLVRWLCSEQ
jgi:pimeloyl-ACP methyl ester carboxylesterase